MSNKLATFFLIVFLVLAGYLFFVFFEPYEDVEDMGWSKAAFRNPLLAAEMFVRQMDAPHKVDVQSRSNFEGLEDLQTVDTIYISNSSQVLTEKRLTSIIAWLKSGGHLIVAAQSPTFSDKDRLLNHFSISTEETDFKPNPIENLFLPNLIGVSPDSESQSSSDDKDLDEKPKKLSEMLREYNELVQAEGEGQKGPKKLESKRVTIPDEQLTHLQFGETESSITIQYNSRRGLYHPFFDHDESVPFEGWQPFYWRGDNYGVHFMQIYVGEGLLSVMSDGAIWRSENIAKAEHAFLLRELAGNTRRIGLFYGLQVASIFELMWRWAPELISVLGVWLLAWLLYRGQRFGRIRKQQITTRRSLLEHVVASASYYWRQRQTQQLLKPLQEDIVSLARRNLPAYERFDVADQYRQLGLQSGLSPSQVEQAMTNSNEKVEEKFLIQVQHLQTIRKSL